MELKTIHDSKTYFSSGRLIDKVRGLVVAAKNKQDDEYTIHEIQEAAKVDRELKVFDYCIADWAIATLRWIDTDYSNSLYYEMVSELSDNEKKWVNELVAKEVFTILFNGD